MKHITINPNNEVHATRDHPQGQALASALPEAKETKVHPSNAGGDDENASLLFVGTATTILEWEGIRLMTDPNFLHAGDHVHLGPGVTGTRKTNPAIDLHDLPRIDLICLSHYHADHFDQKVEASLRRDLPIITTPHAKEQLTSKKSSEEAFTAVHDLDVFQDILVDIEGKGKKPAVKVTGMPGKHVPPGVVGTLNDFINAVPPTNGWMLELGYRGDGEEFRCGYRIYISGDTLLVDELKEIPKRYAGQNIDLMLIHLGGTTVPAPSMPLLMVTMDAEQGLGLVKLVDPDVTIPIHYDDYDVFLSPLDDFKKKMEEAGLGDRVVYLDRKDKYRFKVKE
ncbi:MAG: hypothetical protein Q9225_007270 [Loekoesia sp. 1 TL-2023]